MIDDQRYLLLERSYKKILRYSYENEASELMLRNEEQEYVIDFTEIYAYVMGFADPSKVVLSDSNSKLKAAALNRLIGEEIFESGRRLIVLPTFAVELDRFVAGLPGRLAGESMLALQKLRDKSHSKHLNEVIEKIKKIASQLTISSPVEEISNLYDEIAKIAPELFVISRMPSADPIKRLKDLLSRKTLVGFDELFERKEFGKEVVDDAKDAYQYFAARRRDVSSATNWIDAESVALVSAMNRKASKSQPENSDMTKPRYSLISRSSAMRGFYEQRAFSDQESSLHEYIHPRVFARFAVLKSSEKEISLSQARETSFHVLSGYHKDAIKDLRANKQWASAAVSSKLEMYRKSLFQAEKETRSLENLILLDRVQKNNNIKGILIELTGFNLDNLEIRSDFMSIWEEIVEERVSGIITDIDFLFSEMTAITSFPSQMSDEQTSNAVKQVRISNSESYSIRFLDERGPPWLEFNDQSVYQDLLKVVEGNRDATWYFSKNISHSKFERYLGFSALCGSIGEWRAAYLLVDSIVEKLLSINMTSRVVYREALFFRAVARRCASGGDVDGWEALSVADIENASLLYNRDSVDTSLPFDPRYQNELALIMLSLGTSRSTKYAELLERYDTPVVLWEEILDIPAISDELSVRVINNLVIYACNFRDSDKVFIKKYYTRLQKLVRKLTLRSAAVDHTLIFASYLIGENEGRESAIKQLNRILKRNGLSPYGFGQISKTIDKLRTGKI